MDLVLYYVLNQVSRLDQELKVGATQVEQMVRATLQPTMAQWAIDEAKAAVKAFKETNRLLSFPLFDPLQA